MRYELLIKPSISFQAIEGFLFVAREAGQAADGRQRILFTGSSGDVQQANDRRRKRSIGI